MVVKRSSVHNGTALPEQIPAANARVPRRQPSLNKHPLQEQGRLRKGNKILTESYKVLLKQYYSDATDYTAPLKSA